MVYIPVYASENWVDEAERRKAIYDTVPVWCCFISPTASMYCKYMLTRQGCMSSHVSDLMIEMDGAKISAIIIEDYIIHIVDITFL